MENPLTEELIEELNEIIQLPREEQSIKLKEFFKKLTPEQIEFLKKNQSRQCIFCGISLGQISSYKLYEDNDSVAVLDINPASNGHVIIIPKMHLKYSYELPLRIFEITNLISKKIKDVLGYDTTILISNGLSAGEKFEHFTVNIIPRYEKDNLNFNWNFKKADDKDLIELSNKLKIEIKRQEEPKKFVYREEHKIKRIP